MKTFTTILFTWIIIQCFYVGQFGPELIIFKALRPHHIFAVLTVLAWLMARAAGQTVRRKFEWPERLLIILTMLSTASFIWSGALFDEASGKNKWLVCLFNMTFYPYITYFCVRALPYRKEFLVGFLKLLCYFGVYLALTGVFEHYQMNVLVWPRYIMDPGLGSHFGRARGPFMESVAMGRILSIVFGAWLVLQLESPRRIRLLAFVCIPAAAVAEYFTQTRGPWVGMALIGLAFFVYKTPVRKPLIRLGILVVVVAACGVSSKFSIGGNNLFLERQSTVTDRIVTWITSARMIEAHPLTGIGYGRFNVDWPNYYREGGIEMTGFDGSHNTFLTMGAELGLPALGIFLLVGYLFWRRCNEVYAGLDSSRVFERTFVAFVIGTLWNYFTGWFSDLKWTTSQNTIMFLMLGIVSGMRYDLIENPGGELAGQLEPEAEAESPTLEYA